MKKVVITGGSVGIGYALALKYFKNNYLVYILDKQEPIKTKISDNLIYYKLDINELEQIKTILNEIGTIDLLINNAAVQVEKPFLNQTEEELKTVINTNLLSPIILTHLITKEHMNKGGQVFNISSVHGSIPRKNKISYDVSKAGLEMFTKELALELAPKIRVNAIAIGATKTPMNDNFVNEEKAMNSIKKVPLNYIFNSEDIAEIVFELTSDKFKHMTGSIVVYDGGRSLIG